MLKGALVSACFKDGEELEEGELAFVVVDTQVLSVRDGKELMTRERERERDFGKLEKDHQQDRLTHHQAVHVFNLLIPLVEVNHSLPGLVTSQASSTVHELDHWREDAVRSARSWSKSSTSD